MSNSYIDLCEGFVEPVDTALMNQAKASCSRAQVTEIEGALLHTFKTQTDKIELRKISIAQNKKLQAVAGGDALINPKIFNRMQQALVFK